MSPLLLVPCALVELDGEVTEEMDYTGVEVYGHEESGPLGEDDELVGVLGTPVVEDRRVGTDHWVYLERGYLAGAQWDEEEYELY